LFITKINIINLILINNKNKLFHKKIFLGHNTLQTSFLYLKELERTSTPFGSDKL